VPVCGVARGNSLWSLRSLPPSHFPLPTGWFCKLYGSSVKEGLGRVVDDEFISVLVGYNPYECLKNPLKMAVNSSLPKSAGLNGLLPARGPSRGHVASRVIGMG
jgi:hypothetical protein